MSVIVAIYIYLRSVASPRVESMICPLYFLTFFQPVRRTNPPGIPLFDKEPGSFHPMSIRRVLGTSVLAPPIESPQQILYLQSFLLLQTCGSSKEDRYFSLHQKKNDKHCVLTQRLQWASHTRCSFVCLKGSCVSSKTTMSRSEFGVKFRCAALPAKKATHASGKCVFTNVLAAISGYNSFNYHL
jgi:hypothetical protein